MNRSIESEVLSRYAQGAAQRQTALCCPPIAYEKEYVRNLPAEVVEKDYGCGNPSLYAREGDAVIDLGSGSGKICYILAQKVGAQGRVTGVDFNPPMLALARKYQDEMARKLGYANTRFVRARIQDMALDLDRAEAWLAEHPVRSIEDASNYEAECERLRREQPAVPGGEADLVVSNCVLNLVRPDDKERLFAEIFRVLKAGGRAVISDIVCDEDPSDEVLRDPALWTGCISGAFREDAFLEAFERAGFYGVEILERQAEAWQTIHGIEFRSLTLRAFKGKEGACLERRQAVIYKGPFKQVRDDDGHLYLRGQRAAVCDKTFRLLTNPHGPYAGQFEPVEPRVTTPAEEALPFDCARDALRHPRETKGADFDETRQAEGSCCLGDRCC